MSVLLFLFLVLSLSLQGPNVIGEVSYTCDAWQAGTADAYFAVTAHWVEEHGPRNWELHGALVGFTQMNSAHHGICLGQALFKLIMRIGAIKKASALCSVSMILFSDIFHRLDGLLLTMPQIIQQ